MEKNPRRPNVGILATMTPVYRNIPSIQPKMEKWAGEIVEELERFCNVLMPGIFDSREAAEAALAEIERSDADLLIVFPITYAPSLMILPALQATRLPIVVLNTQILHRWDSDADPDCFIDNQAPTGVFDLTNVLVRQHIPFEIVNGHYKDDHLYREIAASAQAARAVKKIRSMNIGMLGYPMAGSGDFSVDYVSFLGDFGADVIPLDLREYHDVYKNAPEGEVTALIESDRRRFELDASVTDEGHRESAKMEWGLRELIKRYGLSGVTFHFDALSQDGRFVTLPMLAICKLLAEGIGFGGEGDVTSTAAVAAMAALSGEADFFEAWGMDFHAGGILKNHMGEGNIALAREDEPVRLVQAPFGIGGDVEYNLIPVFTLKSGEATFVNLTTGADGKIKLIAAEGEVPEFKPIKGIDSPHGKFLPDSGLERFLSGWAYAGGTHHGSLVYGTRAALIEKTARMLGIGFERV